MTDREFDLLLEEQLTDLPPNDDLVAEITPWRRAANRILLGTALCSITLNFLLLNYILPAIGLGLILLGFRSLRRENRWFRAGYAVAAARMIQCIFNLILSATIWGEPYREATGWMTVIGVSLSTLHALCIWGSFRAVQIKAGAEQSSKGFWLVIFFVIITVLGVAGFQNSLVILILLVLYILLLRSLWKYAGLLDDAGYAVQASPVRLSDRALAIVLAVITAVGILCGYLFCGQYPMEWAEKDTVSAEAEAVKRKLLSMDFPSYVLEDLTEDEILARANAKNVYAESSEEAFNDGQIVIEGDAYYGSYYHTHTEYPVRELLVTHVLVEPADGGNWIILEHFLWQQNPGYRGTDTVQVWPAYARNDGWDKGSRLSGRVLYDRDGLTYAAAYYDLEELTYTSTTFFGAYECTDILASFSLPYRGKKCRGYVCYDMEMVEEGWLISSWCNYSYQEFPAYPQLPGHDFVVGSYSLNDQGYRTRQTQLSIRPNEIEAPYEPEE